TSSLVGTYQRAGAVTSTFLAPLARLERATRCLEGSRSIQLSYRGSAIDVPTNGPCGHHYGRSCGAALFAGADLCDGSDGAGARQLGGERARMHEPQAVGGARQRDIEVAASPW